MALSLSKKNVLSIMAMTLTTISLISPADAQATCTSTSPDCCWVVESWKNMGKTTTVSPTSATACCNFFVSSTGTITTQNSGIPGVRCSSSGIVTEIIWNTRSLKGSIPSSLVNLFSIKYLYLRNNPGLTGTFTPPCGTQTVDVSGTSVTISGCTTTCTSTSPECCWVVESWKKMGKTTTVSPTSATACCSGLPGVGCTSTGKVIYINWASQLLKGQIPSSLGNLKDLAKLLLDNNQLEGQIPSSLGNLDNLHWLDLHNNPGLTGTLTLQCGTNVDILGTKVTICGCVAESTPPALYPPPEIDDDCLASRHALSLSKRSQVYGQVVAKIDNLIFKCHVDAKKNPFADCLNSMAALCDQTRTFYNKTTCKTAVNQMYGQMSEYWQEVRKACGRWPFTQSDLSYTGEVYKSDKCVRANRDLIENAYYSVWNPLTNAYENIGVTSELTDSTNVRLWGQVAE